MRSLNAHFSTGNSSAQLWPCQRICRHTVLVPFAREEVRPVGGDSLMAGGTVRKRLSRMTAAAGQPPSPATGTEEEQQRSSSSSSSSSSSDSGGAGQQQNQKRQQRDPIVHTSNSSNRKSGDRNTCSPFSIDDPQLVVGDCVALTAAALYRQLAAIVLSPSFPGWFAPLTFNPLRFAEFANFAGMLVASWVVAATLTGGYSGAAVGAGAPGALRSVCKAWLVAMPICAAHLVLVTASESQALIGDNGFADVLPLAAAGPGEPLGTAAAVLGLMAMWRSFYAVYLDTWVWASARDVAEDAARFWEALASVALVAAGCGFLLQVLQLTATIHGAAADGVGLGQLLLS